MIRALAARNNQRIKNARQPMINTLPWVRYITLRRSVSRVYLKYCSRSLKLSSLTRLWFCPCALLPLVERLRLRIFFVHQFSPSLSLTPSSSNKNFKKQKHSKHYIFCLLSFRWSRYVDVHNVDVSDFYVVMLCCYVAMSPERKGHNCYQKFLQILSSKIA